MNYQFIYLYLYLCSYFLDPSSDIQQNEYEIGHGQYVDAKSIYAQ